ncbi:uncharacterized protein LOC113334070 [Papaver somniferum]|uniref:uncharacterized protein LOC113334070 n=1 Tax=Papaver somniferum TaxID=3469 RepID=UPI000E6F78AC|nr:uncharacterized protein LOC113334070 [Papaver somniferum]
MKHVLSTIISLNQSAFISGRTIQDNVLVSHEILRNYHRKGGSPRCALKIDIKKSYDSVSWQAILLTQEKFGFPASFIHWIYCCNSTAKFSVMVDGSAYGFFGA